MLPLFSPLSVLWNTVPVFSDAGGGSVRLGSLQFSCVCVVWSAKWPLTDAGVSDCLRRREGYTVFATILLPPPLLSGISPGRLIDHWL